MKESEDGGGGVVIFVGHEAKHNGQYLVQVLRSFGPDCLI